MILASSMPRSVKVKSSKKHQEMGVTSISFNQVDDSIFYIGAESGGMFKCTTNTTPQQMGKFGPAGQSFLVVLQIGVLVKVSWLLSALS